MVTIWGRILGEGGDGVWNATVVFRPSDPPGAYPKFTLSDGDGDFVIEGLKPGAYTVVVTQRFYEVHTFVMQVTHDEYIEVALARDLDHPHVY